MRDIATNASDIGTLQTSVNKECPDASGGNTARYCVPGLAQLREMFYVVASGCNVSDAWCANLRQKASITAPEPAAAD